MVQAGNANRRDNPYDKKIRQWRILSWQVDYQSMEILAFSLVPNLCLKILETLQTVFMSVILLFPFTSPLHWLAISTVKIAYTFQFVKSPVMENREIDAAGKEHKQERNCQNFPVPVINHLYFLFAISVKSCTNSEK